MKPQWIRNLRAVVKEFGIWFLITLPLLFAIRSSLLESFYIPSGSMIPTLMIGDQLLVWKGAYRWKLPFFEREGDPIVLKERSGPQRGDVIVFRYPRDQTLFYVKRVVGVSGDWISIRNRKLMINDQPVSNHELSAEQVAALPNSLEFRDFAVLNENLDGHDHLILQDRNQFVSEHYGPVAIPPGHVFVLGDNRDFSNDSRFWGFVPLNLIEGRALRVWMRFNLNLSPFQFDFSLTRLGSRL